MGAAAAIGGATLVSGYMGAKAAGDAADTSAAASNYAASLQNDQYLQNREDMMPWQNAGVNALSQYSNYGRSQVGQGGYGLDSRQGQYGGQNFDITKDPSYQFRQGEQERSINRNMAGMGKFMSGNRLEELMARSGEMASQEYSNAYGRNVQDFQLGQGVNRENYGRGVDAYGRAYGQEGDYLNRLAALSNIGQTATTNTANMGTASAANIGNLQMQGANAQAAAQIGQGNAWQSAIGSGMGLYGYMNQPQTQQNQMLNNQWNSW